MSDDIPPALPRLPVRSANSHKGDFGRILLVGGSLGMAGSISLAGMAALRSGAGLVRIASAKSATPIIATFDPCYMTVGLPEDAHGQIQTPADALVDHANWSSVMGIGPGLGQSAEVTWLVRDLVAKYHQPLVVDADGLNALAECPEISFGSNQVVLTPHPGEFRRLLEAGHGESELQTIGPPSETDQEAAAMSFAQRHNVVLVLKGNRTIITDGRSLYRNTTGNPGMATGGSGDVLTGVVSAMLAHGLEALQAARLAVHIHGLAGDLAAESLGQISMTARDIVDFLPQAFGRMIR